MSPVDCISICLAEAQADNGGIFSGSWAEAVWTVIAFILLLVVLGKFAWRPLLAQIKARQAHIQQQLEQTQQANKQAQLLLEQARQEGLLIVEQARQQAQQQQNQIIRQTKAELDRLRQDVEADIEHAKMAALEAVWQQSTQIVQSLTERVLGRAVSEQDCTRLIQEAIEQVRSIRDRI